MMITRINMSPEEKEKRRQSNRWNENVQTGHVTKRNSQVKAESNRWNEDVQTGHVTRRNSHVEGEGNTCVCFWPLVTKWGTVMHEIPISSPPLDDIPSIPYMNV